MCERFWTLIADNRLTEASVWDDRLLAESLKELSELELDFGIEATGFTMGEIDLRIEGLPTTGDDEPDMADRLPTPNNQFAISKSGDIWHLRRARESKSTHLIPDSHGRKAAGKGYPPTQGVSNPVSCDIEPSSPARKRILKIGDRRLAREIE